MYGINTIIKCGTWQPVKFQLVSRSWNEMIFNRMSELMLPTLIQSYDKNHFMFEPVQKTRDNWNFTDCQMPHIDSIFQFIKPDFDKNVYFEGIWSL